MKLDAVTVQDYKPIWGYALWQTLADTQHSFQGESVFSERKEQLTIAAILFLLKTFHLKILHNR